jgi:ATP-dependent DNA helicase PIF1
VHCDSYPHPGDFRQILPVIPRGSRAQVVSQCLKKSTLWNSFSKHHLTVNMRVQLASAAGDAANAIELSDFGDWLLRLGEGTLPSDVTNADLPFAQDGDSWILIPDKHLLPDPDPASDTALQSLMDFVFPDLADNHQNPEWMGQRAILTPTNVMADEINERLTVVFPLADPSHEKCMISCDEVSADDDPTIYPVEFLNSCNLPCVPPHRLHLKKHAPVILLRNIAPREGHCNGTRYTIAELHNRIVKLRATTGPGAGSFLYLPRITLSPSDTVLPFTLKRRQYPIKVAFGLTINKAQGQSLDIVGINLAGSQVFTHGQAYVAFSRTGDPNKLRVLSSKIKHLKNVVYPEVLQ